MQDLIHILGVLWTFCILTSIKDQVGDRGIMF